MRSTIPFTLQSGTPTPFVSPTGQITVVPTITNGPLIFLDADKNQLTVNDKVTIKVRIDSQGKYLKSYTFNIKYDPAYFQIKDADASKANVQIFFKDTYFTIVQNETDISTGSITLSADAPDGNPATIAGRDVAEFELYALKEGASTVSVVKANSSLLDENNIDVSTVGLNQTLDIIISNTGVTQFPQLTITPLPTGDLPKNGIFDTFGTTQAVLIGAVLVTLGVYLNRIKNRGLKE